MTVACLTTSSYAKINLYLNVVDKRPDGYHNIETFFQEIDLCDDVHIQVEPAPTLSISGECTGLNEPFNQNLAYRAAALFGQKMNLAGRWHIQIKKHIPIGAGLGGGSSNAAAVLSLLSQYFKTGNPQQLQEMAASLGADVPFFLKGGGAWAEGIGEKLTFMPGLTQGSVVLILPQIHVSTAKVYQNLKTSLTEKIKGDKILDALQKNDLLKLGQALYNKLEEVSFSLYPELRTIKSKLLTIPSRGTLMSGSGSAFFILTDHETEGRRVLEEVRRLGYCGMLTKPVVR